MDYEIDFIGVNKDKASEDADAIAFRYRDSDNKFKVFVYDGGLDAHGEALVKLLNDYYFCNGEEKVIEAVIVSHSHEDHTVGLKRILKEFRVNALYMNRPWLYIDELFKRVNDGRITKNSLEDRLKKSYHHISDLEELANEYNISIHEAFANENITDKLKILSPNKSFYIDLLTESRKTPASSQESNFTLDAFNAINEDASYANESWEHEMLREDVTTSAENEMSVVLFGNMNGENFLLVGDAGIKALTQACDCYKAIYNRELRDDVKYYQIPHHGGRHNVSPSVLDRLIGEKISKGSLADKVAYVSVARDSSHPKKMVVNAYIRRGVQVYKTNGSILSDQHGNMSNRAGWGKAQRESFSMKVEAWDKND